MSVSLCSGYQFLADLQSALIKNSAYHNQPYICLLFSPFSCAFCEAIIIIIIIIIVTSMTNGMQSEILLNLVCPNMFPHKIFNST